MPYFSIIIPVKALNNYVRETVAYIQKLTGPEWELLIIPNEEEPNEWLSDTRITIKHSGRVGPAEKRDMGARWATGEILVFLDDDSYPSAQLLETAKTYFYEDEIVAIGGPAITPTSDNFWQRVSGAVFLSSFSGGAPERYVPIGRVRAVDDWPSVNLMVRKSDFLFVGGFDSPYWPGEDTKLCLDLVQKTGKKIIYVPEMHVWHHRRAGLAAHLKQIGGYGVHRGYFAKKYPKTSRKLLYFIPSAFLLFTLVTFVSFFITADFPSILIVGWISYAFALCKVWFDIRKYETTTVAIMALPYTLLTHLWYGHRFIQGLLITNLISRLR